MLTYEELIKGFPETYPNRIFEASALPVDLGAPEEIKGLTDWGETVWFAPLYNGDLPSNVGRYQVAMFLVYKGKHAYIPEDISYNSLTEAQNMAKFQWYRFKYALDNVRSNPDYFRN